MPDGFLLGRHLPFRKRLFHPSVDVKACFQALPWILFPRFEHEGDQKSGTYRQDRLQQGFGKDKVRSVLIQPALITALVGKAVQALLHPPDIPAGIPEYIVLRADKNELPANVLHFDPFLFPDGMPALRFVKHLPGGDFVAAGL